MLSEAAGVVTAAFWNEDQVELTQSENLTVTCSVVGADRYDVIRVVHSYGAKTLLLADNNAISPVFASLSRYHVTHQYRHGTALVTVHINGQLSHRLNPHHKKFHDNFTYVQCESKKSPPPEIF